MISLIAALLTTPLVAESRTCEVIANSSYSGEINCVAFIYDSPNGLRFDFALTNNLNTITVSYVTVKYEGSLNVVGISLDESQYVPAIGNCNVYSDESIICRGVTYITNDDIRVRAK